MCLFITLLDQIKQTCGVKYDDLGYTSEKEFDIAIEIYITAIKTWINMYTNKIKKSIGRKKRSKMRN